jgi:hypothetical protein
MHLADEDEFISKSAQAEIKAVLAGKANTTVYGVSVTFSPGTMAHTTMRQRRPSPTGGQPWRQRRPSHWA